MREIIINLILNFIRIWSKKRIFWGLSSWFRFNNLGLALGIALNFYTSVEKELKPKVIWFYGANSYVCKSYMRKTGRGAFCPVKVKRAQEARVNQFLFQIVQNNKIFKISKIFKNNCWINVNHTKNKHLQFIGLVVLFCCTLFW